MLLSALSFPTVHLVFSISGLNSAEVKYWGLSEEVWMQKARQIDQEVKEKFAYSRKQRETHNGGKVL